MVTFICSCHLLFNQVSLVKVVGYKQSNYYETGLDHVRLLSFLFDGKFCVMTL